MGVKRGVGHLKSLHNVETRMPDRSGQKQCPICPKIVRGDHLGRHLATHKKDFIARMGVESKQAVCEIKKPIMYGGDAHACKCFAVCLHCNRFISGVAKVQSNIFIQKHATKECLEAWPSYEALFAHTPPCPPETPIQNVLIVADSRPETRNEKKGNVLSDSTVEMLRAWGRSQEEEPDWPLDDLVQSLLEYESYYKEK